MVNEAQKLFCCCRLFVTALFIRETIYGVLIINVNLRDATNQMVSSKVGEEKPAGDTSSCRNRLKNGGCCRFLFVTIRLHTRRSFHGERGAKWVLVAVGVLLLRNWKPGRQCLCDKRNHVLPKQLIVLSDFSQRSTLNRSRSLVTACKASFTRWGELITVGSLPSAQVCLQRNITLHCGKA